jgi:hypothetical protein
MKSILHYTGFLFSLFCYYVLRMWRKPLSPEALKSLELRLSALVDLKTRKYEQRFLQKYIKKHSPFNLLTNN